MFSTPRTPHPSTAGRTNFGQIRLWGCVSWGICVYAVSFLMEILNSVDVMWLAYSVLAPCASFFSYLLLRAEFPSGKKGVRRGGGKESESMLSSIQRFAMFPLTVPFMSVIMTLGALFATLNTYVYIWAVQDLGASYQQIGIATVVLNSCEVRQRVDSFILKALHARLLAPSFP